MHEREALAMLQETFDRTEVFAFEYRDYETAKAVQVATKGLLERLAGERPDDGLPSGASVWVGTDPATESRIFVMVADTGIGLREQGEWRDGAAYEMPERLRLSLAERHLGKIFEAAASGLAVSSRDVHYGLGAVLRRGNDLRPRVGRG